ncbi:MAG: hypothetical protein R2939_17360 [Kofleriaceae bacterium]
MAMALAVAGCKGKDKPADGKAPTTAAAASGPLGPGCFTRAACAEACVAGAPGACVELYQWQHHGWGAAASGEPAAPLEHGCQAGDAQACAALASDLDPADPARAAAERTAMAASDAACARGDGDGCAMAAAFMPGDDDAPRLERTKRACTAGSAEACQRLLMFQLGQLLVDPSEQPSADPHDLEKVALAALERGCANRDVGACVYLSMFGDHEDADLERGLVVLRARCAADHPSSCAQLGDIQLDLQEDVAAATASFERACALGVKPSCARTATPDPRTQGRFKVVRHEEHAAGCDGPGAPAATPVAAFELTVEREPLEIPRLDVWGCDGVDDVDCDQAVGWQFDTLDGTAWAPADGNTMRAGADGACDEASFEHQTIAVADDGRVTLRRETWATPTPATPAACAATRTHDKALLRCAHAEVLVGERVAPTP